MNKLTETIKHLVIVNVLFFVATLIFKDTMYDLFAMHHPNSPLFKPWQIVTHIFMHGNFDGNGNVSVNHILFNMIGLWMFGGLVEQKIGQKNFLILYFIAGIGAALFSLGIDYIQLQSMVSNIQTLGLSRNEVYDLLHLKMQRGYKPSLITDVLERDYVYARNILNKFSVGASGSLFGVMIASAFLFPNIKMGPMFLPISFEAKYFIPVILLAEVYFGFLGPADNIGHFAHIGGAIFGFLVIWMMHKRRFKDYF